MDGDGNGSATIAAKNTSHRRKSVGECGGLSCLPSRFFLSRLCNGQKSRFCGNAEERRKGKKEVIEKLNGKKKNKMVMASVNRESSTTLASEESGQRKEVSFNYGIGYGLIYLLAASKNELTKVQKLHKEMEMLLQNLKNRLQNHAPLKQNNIVISSPSNNDVSFQELLSSSRYLDDDDYDDGDISECCIISRQESIKKMDLLEAELEAELEHLQLQLDTELLLYRKREYNEIIVEDSAPEESQITSFGEVIDDESPPQVMVHNEQQYGGVSPRELERKLHQLLEARQQERIKELELALDRAKKKIHEKEKELSWWKDTAKLVYHHVPDTSRL